MKGQLDEAVAVLVLESRRLVGVTPAVAAAHNNGGGQIIQGRFIDQRNNKFYGCSNDNEDFLTTTLDPNHRPSKVLREDNVTNVCSHSASILAVETNHNNSGVDDSCHIDNELSCRNESLEGRNCTGPDSSGVKGHSLYDTSTNRRHKSTSVRRRPLEANSKQHQSAVCSYHHVVEKKRVHFRHLRSAHRMMPGDETDSPVVYNGFCKQNISQPVKRKVHPSSNKDNDEIGGVPLWFHPIGQF